MKPSAQIQMSDQVKLLYYLGIFEFIRKALISLRSGRAPLGAPPWRFWAGGRASISAISCGSVQRAPRSQVVMPGGRGPQPSEASGYEPQAAERHSPLRLQDRLRRRPS